MPEPAPRPGHPVLYTRVPQPLYDRVRAEAASKGETVATVVRWALQARYADQPDR